MWNPVEEERKETRWQKEQACCEIKSNHRLPSLRLALTCSVSSADIYKASGNLGRDINHSRWMWKITGFPMRHMTCHNRRKWQGAAVSGFEACVTFRGESFKPGGRKERERGASGTQRRFEACSKHRHTPPREIPCSSQYCEIAAKTQRGAFICTAYERPCGHVTRSQLFGADTSRAALFAAPQELTYSERLSLGWLRLRKLQCAALIQRQFTRTLIRMKEKKKELYS